jgi:hypothetical protein
VTGSSVTGTTICAGCDKPLPPPSPRGGRPRKWCSDECRRRGWDRENVNVLCACGKRIEASKVRQGTTRCRECFLAAEERRIRERADRIAVMWADGASWKAIAVALGWKPGRMAVEFNRIRRRWPELLPYRHRGYGDRTRAQPVTDGES